MAEMKQAEKMAKIREQALTMISIPEDATQIGVATFLVKTEFGVAEVKVTARKGEVDLAEEAEAFEFELEEKRVKAEARKAEAEAKKQANLAKKAKNAKPKAE